MRRVDEHSGLKFDPIGEGCLAFKIGQLCVSLCGGNMVEHYIAEQRAISLATVLLTRDPRVQEVTPASLRAGYDLEVRIGERDEISAKTFAVELKARASVKRLGRLDNDKLWLAKDLKLDMHAIRNTLAVISYPLLFIAFAMDTDRAFYTWLLEPYITSTRQRKLETSTIETAEEWTPTTHATIIDSVNHWYDISRIDYFRSL
jgi:hypothetical protein